MADYGASLARGIQLGEGSRRRGELDLEGIIASLPGTRGWSSRRGSPAIIRSRAADQALEERRMELLERQQALEERKQAMAEQAWREQQAALQRAMEERRIYGEEGAALGVRGRAERASDRAYEAQTRATETGIQSYEYSKADKMRSQMEDYNLAKAGLGSGNPAPVINYFDKYGSPSMRVEDIQFGKGPHDPVQVTFSNKPDEPATFQDPGQAMMLLLAPTNPLLQEGEAAAAEPQKEEKAIDPIKLADLMRKVSADVDESMQYGTRPAEYKTDAEWRAALMKQKKREILGAAEPTGPEPPPAAGVQRPQPGVTPAEAAQTPQVQEIPIVNKRTGEAGVRRVFPDGTQEIINAKGQLVERRAPGGRRYQPVPPEEEMSMRGEVHTLPIPREGEGAQRAGGIPERPSEGAAPSKNVAYHTDAEGNKVASWVNERGEVETRKVEGEGKDKKKKKKKGSKGGKS